MANTKTKAKVGQILIYLYLILFPLGQLMRHDLAGFPFRLPIHATDLVALIVFTYWIAINIRKQNIVRGYYANFLLTATFSLFLSFFLFKTFETLYGSFYLLRLAAYYAMFLVVSKLVNADKVFRDRVFRLLLYILIFIAAFGWIQYFFYPDLTYLKYLGWDDHLYRLAGSFLDPGFTGILMVFGSLISLATYKITKNKAYILLTVIFILTTLFTYSRASILALVVGITYYLFKINSRNALKYTAISLITISLVIVILPRTAGHGVRLERLYSVNARITNYKESVLMWKQSPVFGVGYNNTCLARNLFINKDSFESHSCSGTDSSLLMVLVTTGVVGLLILLNAGARLTKTLRKNVYSTLFLSCLAALLVHSLFVNSLFYPWVMGWMGILLGVVYSFNKK